MIHLDAQEKIVVEARRHWYVFAAEVSSLALLALLPFAAFIVLASSGAFEAVEGLLSLFVFVSAGWLLALWTLFFIFWTNYYLDVWIVTDRRIIDVEQHGLFSREISEFRLENIEDLTVEVKGLLPTFLRFGDVYVQTAGENREFAIHHVPNPHKLKDIIVAEQHRVLSEKRG